MLKNLKNNKMILIGIFQSFVTLLVGILAVYSLNSTNSSYSHVTNINMPHSLLASEMMSNMRRLRIGLRTVVLPHIDQKEIQSALDKAEDGKKSFEENLVEFKSTKYENGQPFGPGEKEIFDDLLLKWNHFKEITDNSIKLGRSGNPKDLEKVIETFYKEDPVAAQVTSVSLQKLIDYQTTEAEKWVKDATERGSKSIRNIAIVIVIGLIISLFSSYWFGTRVSAKIAAIVDKLSNNAVQVSDVSNQLGTISETLSSTSVEQASALQETSASLEETSVMVTKNAENAKNSSVLSSDSQKWAKEGIQSVHSVVQAINEISDSNERIIQEVNESNKEISDIVRVITAVGEKTKVINDIVFQTKLLSFNASVEAARAGEYGKGFAVVAEEVGKLAAMSGTSAKEINDLLKDSIDKVEKTVQNAQDRIRKYVDIAKERVQNGAKTASQCNETLDHLVENVEKSNELAEQIAQASKEQAQGVQEINKAIAELNSASQNTNSIIQQTGQSAETLKSEVHSMRGLLEDLHEVIAGSKG